MSMYAIIEDSGTQIRVREGDVIRVDQRELADDTASLTFDRVLMIGHEQGDGENAGSPKIGQPVLEGAKVTADILSDDVSEKYHIYKIRRRKNYRRHTGHRQHYIQVRVTGIEGSARLFHHPSPGMSPANPQG